MGWVWVVVAIVVIVGLWFVFTYNSLVSARNRTQEAWSEIDVELKRRHDLIPNLVNTVQGYVGHERGRDARSGNQCPSRRRRRRRDRRPCEDRGSREHS